MSENNQTLFIKSFTWNRDSHGLFDYESHHISKNNVKTSSDAKIIRIKNDIHLLNDFMNETSLSENSKILAIIKKEKENFVVRKSMENTKKIDYNSEENLWFVVKGFNEKIQKKFKLKKGDIIKFGKVIFSIKELKITKNKAIENNLDSPLRKFHIDNYKDSFDETNFNLPLNDLHFDEIHEDKSENWKKYHYNKEIINKDAICRVCYEKNDELNTDLLISPCNCIGSVKYIHINCLKSWLNSQSIQRSTLSVNSNYWKKYECELCHKILPDVINLQKEKYELLDCEKKENIKNYLILEYLPSNNSGIRNLHFVDFDKNKIIKIGRDGSNDVKINDISVSRCHAFIKFENDEIYLEDSDSKFGTLVFIHNKLEIKKEEAFSIQIGNTFINFHTKGTNIGLKKRKLVSLNSSVDASKENTKDEDFSENPRKQFYKYHCNEKEIKKKFSK